jgi:hypothetical protein
MSTYGYGSLSNNENAIEVLRHAHGMRNEMTILSELNYVPTKWPILVVKVHNRLLPFIWKDGEPFQFYYSG